MSKMMKVAGRYDSTPRELDSGDAGALALNKHGWTQVDQFFKGNPFVANQTCAVADTEYIIDINASLGRNSRFGQLRAAQVNSGTVQVAFSHNGITHTAWLSHVYPGETIDLTGIDIDSIKVKSDGAGDVVTIVAY
jgi:hypothetical protein